MKKFVLILMLGFLVGNVVEAQQKYAVLICGAQVHTSPGDANGMLDYTGTTGFYHWTEFWAEIYNTWEMLIKPVDLGGKGFLDENVYVLYADGIDFSIPASDWIADKYNPLTYYAPYAPIVDYSATKANLEMVFNGLATGQGDFPLLTEDDFLFLWTFGHGFTGPEDEYSSYLQLYPGEIYKDEDFASKTDQINCGKKVFWLLQCHSGGFIPKLEIPNNSVIEFNQSKDYHISLLFGETDEKLMPDPKDQRNFAGRIIRNSPNPFSGTTEVSFELNESADVMISIISELGQKHEVVHQPNVSKGINRIYFSSSAYPDGMYICILEINGEIVDTRKIIIAN
ncbi:MAG: T9SS type A sorting domain-containing protein [Clostridia bacterium]|nr:T9SS type A sorting domain-containing protein [Clostridia bacterium]